MYDIFVDNFSRSIFFPNDSIELVKLHKKYEGNRHERDQSFLVPVPVPVSAGHRDHFAHLYFRESVFRDFCYQFETHYFLWNSTSSIRESSVTYPEI
jgi:hypothetical protein